ncbi:MAG: hypothetical protein MI757_18270 [Pirellulales bacterium]|nr:hypothetical protein [Pirellulales bacterium]
MKLSKTNIGWLVAYAIWIAAFVVALLEARRYTIAHLSGAQSQADWQRFKEDARAKSGIDGPIEGPVQRKVPKPDEPPQLLLLRDYFAVCLAGTLLFGSVLFVMLMVAIRGSLSRPRE